MSISKFLKKYYIEGVFFTHVSMISPSGAYQLNSDSIEEFWEIYCTSVQNGKIVGIAEKPAHYIPILCDIDIKILESDLENINYDKENNHLYTQKQLNSVIEVYQSVLRNIIDGCTDEQLTCVVLEKPMYTITKNGVTYYKSGFHLQMMGVFLSKMDHENQFLPRVRDIIKELKIFEDLGFEDSGSLVDGGYTKSPWLLYGGKKDGDNMTPYKITKIINSVGEEICVEEAFKYYSIYDVKEKLMIIRDNIDFYLPRILSIVPNGRLCNELKYGLSSPIRDSISKKDKERIKDSDTEVSITQTLRTSKKLLPMLANFRADDRNEWMTIGWILHSIGDGCPEAFEQWLEFSSKNEEKFDENECLNLWEKMVKRDFTIGTLKYYAKLDNPELYKEYQKEQGDKFVRESLEGSSHNDIAKLMFEEYGTEFVCSSFVNKTWFQFKNHHWEEIEDGIFLRELISSDIIKIYGKHGSELFANSAINEDPGYQEKIKRLQKLIANLKNSPFKTNIMKEAAEVFFDRKFKHKLDSNPYLIGFKNGVYDLKLNTFRSGRPEDYISKCMPINYINFNNTDNRVLEVNDYLEKVFPDKSVRTYFLDQTSDVFEGGNNQKVIIFWTGEGDNAKSVTQNIVERMLGEYAIKFNTTLVTGKKSSTGSANPELARAGGGVRWAVLEEPDGDEELNIGILKSLSGNDTYWARDLFEKGKSTREIKPMFKLTFICNELRPIRNSDAAFWNRAKVIPFESTFVRKGDPCPTSYEEQLLQKRFPRDTDFDKKIVGLLEPFAWILLEHRKNIQGKGRVEPEKVKMATEQYRKQNDIYRQFVDECIVESQNYITLIQIYASFREWYKQGFTGGCSITKNDLQKHFLKIWGEPEKGIKWFGHRIITSDEELENNIEDGTAIALTEDDLIDYDDTNSICSRSSKSRKTTPNTKQTRILL